ncbi:creatininase family protein [Candidatus Palauibacter sp.]|uniref:creatininase family protein n=1 Tax=Candidatus Palauibacter sp. TaxID=3101350 RepID=UPI003AF27DBA
MTLRRLPDLTWEDVGALDLDRTVAILPVGATEAHGPHLPLDTDVTIAAAMAEAGGRRLSAHGLEAVLLDALQYTPAAFAASFPGTISIGGATLAALLTDLAASVQRAGIPTLAIANAHFDPTHLRALHTAVSAINAGGVLRAVFPDVTRRPWGGRLTAEFRSGACHAGQYEGSIVLARSPERVRGEVMRELDDNPVSLSAAIAEGAQDFVAAGGPQAYFGSPAAATAEEGHATIETLGDILSEAVIDALGTETWPRTKEQT